MNAHKQVTSSVESSADFGKITAAPAVDHKHNEIISSYSTSEYTANAHHHNEADGGQSWSSSTAYWSPTGQGI